MNLDFGNLAVVTIIKYTVMVAVPIVVLVVLFKILSKPKENEHVQAVECLGCGWRGSVSRYAGRCPKCNNPLGDLKAGR